jgi:hypothetical protein
VEEGLGEDMQTLSIGYSQVPVVCIFFFTMSMSTVVLMKQYRVSSCHMKWCLSIVISRKESGQEPGTGLGWQEPIAVLQCGGLPLDALGVTGWADPGGGGTPSWEVPVSPDCSDCRSPSLDAN